MGHLKLNIFKNLAVMAAIAGSTQVHAKIGDFNEMIRSNNKIEKEIHSEIRDHQGWEKPTYQPPQAQQVVLGSTVSNYDPKTKKSLLKYQKEQVSHQPAYKKQLGRVATEVKNSQD